MSSDPSDQARASLLVKVSPETAFRVFTEEIDMWWRRGPAYRAAGKRRGIICLESGVGGRLFESFDDARGETRVVETGLVTAWEPPSRLVFEWRNTNFAPHEVTEVEVLFEPSASGTYVTVTHRGWSSIPGDHPVRHGMSSSEFLAQRGMQWAEQLRSLARVAAG